MDFIQTRNGTVHTLGTVLDPDVRLAAHWLFVLFDLMILVSNPSRMNQLLMWSYTSFDGACYKMVEQRKVLFNVSPSRMYLSLSGTISERWAISVRIEIANISHALDHLA
jgi:hypothetical protein